MLYAIASRFHCNAIILLRPRKKSFPVKFSIIYSFSVQVGHMMRWLYEALDAENANIHLQLSYNLHPSMFGRPKRRFRQQH